MNLVWPKVVVNVPPFGLDLRACLLILAEWLLPLGLSGPCSEQRAWGRRSIERGTSARSLKLFLFIEAT